jgi:hypothetical protein
MLPAVHAFDKAHTVMLVEEGLLERAAGAAILRGLRGLESEGVVETRARVGGGLHSGEQYLIRLLGEDVGGRFHLARSSGDLSSVAINTLQREKLLALMRAQPSPGLPRRGVYGDPGSGAALVEGSRRDLGTRSTVIDAVLDAARHRLAAQHHAGSQRSRRPPPQATIRGVARRRRRPGEPPGADWSADQAPGAPLSGLGRRLDKGRRGGCACHAIGGGAACIGCACGAAAWLGGIGIVAPTALGAPAAAAIRTATAWNASRAPPRTGR